MAAYNHSLCYRPLVGGIAILNPNVAELGTLGFVATADGADRWLVSCYHVLGRKDLSAFTDGEPIYQPVDDANQLVARVATARADAQLDCAAARLEPGVAGSGAVLGLPAVVGVREPAVGLRVIKSGCITGVTEGVVTGVNTDTVSIGIPSGFPGDYELSREGDSGALWMTEAGHGVALHRAGNAYGATSATGSRLSAVLAALQLRLM